MNDFLRTAAPSNYAEDIRNAQIACATLLNLSDMVKQGCHIADIRKLINIYPDPKPKDSDSSDPNDPKEKGQKDATDSDSESKKDNRDGSDCAREESNEDADTSENSQSEDSDADKGLQPDNEKKPKNQNHKGKRGAYDVTNATDINLHHGDLKPKDPCPCCGKGKVYPHLRHDGLPRANIWFEGGSPITAKRYIFHDLRCGLCKKIFSVSPPEELVADGWGKEERIGYSAIVTLVILKYFSAIPWSRLSRLQETYGLPFSESSQWDQVEKFANASSAIFKVLKILAALCRLFYGDDTGNKIRSKTCELIPTRGSNKVTLRDGCHSSVIIAVDEEGHHIVLVKTAIIHLGEWLDEVLKERPDHLPAPQVMSDCATVNKITACESITLACNQHGRNRFKELKDQFPGQCKQILKLYKLIFKNDRKTSKMGPKERLDYHTKHSKPLMDGIFTLVKKWKEKKLAPDNSDFGGALNYFINHEEKLRGYLKYEGAPLSNNISEQQMIKIALLRNNSKLFLTEFGAQVASQIFSLGLTALLCDANLRDYFTAIFRHQDLVKSNPEGFLPWNYKTTIAKHTMTKPIDVDQIKGNDNTTSESTGPPLI